MGYYKDSVMRYELFVRGLQWEDTGLIGWKHQPTSKEVSFSLL